jgi:hypothetical protein
VTAAQRAALRWIISNAAEDRDSRDGWCRWATLEDERWRWDDYRPLVAAGLVERRETWKDVLLKPTPAGWHRLASDEDRKNPGAEDG